MKKVEKKKDHLLPIYVKALEEAADGVQITDLEGYIIYSNRAIEDIYGYSPAEYRGRHVNEMNADPDYAERVIIPSIKETGRWAGEIWVKHKNGTVFPIWLTTSLVTDDSGIPVAMIGIIRDITELKQTEQAILESKIQLGEQLSFANALNMIAENIIAYEDTTPILETMVRIIGETLGLDRAIIYDVRMQTNLSTGLCEWDNPEIPEIFPIKRSWRVDRFMNAVKYLTEERSWIASHADNVHPIIIADNTRELFHEHIGTKSILFYPFSFRPDGFYLLIFHQLSNRREWRKEEMEFVNAVAKQVEIAIQKINFIEERQKNEQIIWQEKERALITLQSIGDAVITTDAEGNVDYLNPVAEDLTGWKSAEAKGKLLTEVFRISNEITGKPAENPVVKCIQEGRIIGLANNTVLLHREGRKFAIEDSASPIRNREGEITGAVLVFHDVTEKRNLLKQMIHQANHDPLTGLPNRTLFNDRLKLALRQIRRSKKMLAVLFIDLDYFKLVNDTLGHDVGDGALIEVADKITECLRESDTVARLGGDEFAILLPKIVNEDDAARVAQKINRAFQQPWVLQNQEFHITVSIGIALYPNDGADAETLLRHADTAMYRTKEQGRNGYQLFTAAMNEKIMERLTLENSMRQALKREEFTLFYQPQVNTETGQITGMEALIRWQHPERGLVFPDEFIPLAEDTGLIVPIGEWVLHTACKQNKVWQDAGMQPVRVMVNLSARQFQQTNLVEIISRVLEHTGLEPRWLELEITESALMQDLDFTVNMLQELRKMGVRISIDDFGTGYSSLNYLKLFPVNALKIDRAFVCDITTNRQDAAIVSAIIVLGQNLNLQLIAEGVETEEQRAFLKWRQCSEMQGFLFSKPLPACEFEKMLDKGKIN